MRFACPLMLVLAAAVPFVGLWWNFLRARREKSLAKLTLDVPKSRWSSLQSGLILAGLFLALFAASRPQWGKSQERFVARSRNVVIAIDVSRSMLAEDVRPNRLERAKADVADLIDSLEDDRCALVAFRRTGVVICPLTTDHGYLRGALEQMSPESAPRGETDLGSAIRASLEALDPAADDHNAIIMISDGGDLRGEAAQCEETRSADFYCRHRRPQIRRYDSGRGRQRPAEVQERNRRCCAGRVGAQVDCGNFFRPLCAACHCGDG